MDIRKITREELYKQVWNEPLTSLSKKYNLSDNGLRKWCKKIEIPLPKAGHWAKVKYSYKVEKAKLPKMTSEAEKADKDRLAKVNYYPQRESNKQASSKVESSYVKRLREVKEDLASEIESLKDIKSYSPIVAKAKKSLYGKNYKEYRYEGIYRTGDGVVNIFSSEPLFERSLKLMESFIRLMKKRGHIILAEDSKVVVFGVETIFGIREKMKAVNIESDSQYSWTRRELQPKGILCFYLYESSYKSKEWLDKTKQIEERLLEIVAFFEEYALKEIQEKKKAKRRQVISDLQDFIRHEKHRRREDQILRMKCLIRDSEIWKRAQVVREYIEALESQDVSKQYIDWAKEKVDWFDPFTNKDDRFLDDDDRERILKELKTEQSQGRLRSNWSSQENFWKKNRFWK